MNKICTSPQGSTSSNAFETLSNADIIIKIFSYLPPNQAIYSSSLTCRSLSLLQPNICEAIFKKLFPDRDPPQTGSYQYMKAFTLAHRLIKTIKSAQPNIIESVSSLIDAGANIDGFDHLDPPLIAAIEWKNALLITWLLKEGANVNCQNIEGNTPLHIAAMNGDPEMIKQLIHLGAHVALRNYKNETPLHQVIRFCPQEHKRPHFIECIKILIASDIDVNSVDREHITTFHRGVLSQGASFDILRSLLSLGANPNLPDEDGRTPLISLLLSEQRYITPMVHFLIKNGADVNLALKDGTTPAILAIQLDKQELLDSFLSAGAHLTFSLLKAAFEYFDLTCVDFLISKDIKVGETDADGCTLIHWAVQKRLSLSRLQRMIELPINIEALNQKGHSALHLAINPSLDDPECFTRTSEEILDLLISRSSLSTFGPLNWSLIHLAVECGNELAVKKLIEKGLSIDSQDIHGNTPLHLAVELNSPAMIKFLIKNGAQLNLCNALGQTPFSQAICLKHSQAAEALIDCGVSIDERDIENKTPLHKAVESNNLEQVLRVLKYSPLVNAKDNNGDTPLHLSMSSGNYDIVKMLIENGADVDQKNLKGESPLVLALNNEHYKIMCLLINSGANFTITLPKGITLLRFSLTHALTLVSAAMITMGADINEIDENQDTALHSIIKKGHHKTLLHLLTYSPNLNLRNGSGHTPLYIAASTNQLESVASLIQFGANIYITDNEGDNSIDIAVKMEHRAVVEHFLSLGQRLRISTLHHITNHMFMQLERGVDGDSVYALGKTYLHWSIVVKSFRLTQALLDKKVNPDASDGNGYTSLHYAALQDENETLKLLIQSGCSINKRHRDDGRTALHLAIQSGNFEAANTLLQAGALPTVLDENGQSPLHYLMIHSPAHSKSNIISLADKLLASEAQIDVQDAFEKTAYDYLLNSDYLCKSTDLCRKLKPLEHEKSI